MKELNMVLNMVNHIFKDLIHLDYNYIMTKETKHIKI